MTNISADAYRSADEVIKGVLDAIGIDYTPGRDEIARVFDEDLWNGNWDSSTDFAVADVQLEDLRFIQEDEYDQHMDDDEDKPSDDDQIGYFAGHYTFLA